MTKPGVWNTREVEHRMSVISHCRHVRVTTRDRRTIYAVPRGVVGGFAVLVPWGCAYEMRLAFGEIRNAEAADVHEYAKFKEIANRQRAGDFATVIKGPKPGTKPGTKKGAA